MADEFTFMKLLKHFTFSEKVEMLKFCKLKKVSAGQRFFPGSDRIDSFNLVLKGKVGIFYPSAAKIKLLSDQLGRVQYCNLAEAKRRLEKKQSVFMTEKRLTSKARSKLSNQNKIKSPKY